MSESIKIKKAKEFSLSYLGEKPRYSGESYYEHSLHVYKSLIKTGITDEVMMCGALLHHVSKETDSLLEKEFGLEVVDIVKGLRKLSEYDIRVSSPKKNNDKYFIQTYLNLTNDIRVLLVRLIDRSVNIKTAYVHPPLLRSEIGEKALYLYAPICRLMGFSSLTSILEDEAFKILYPDHYYNLVKLVDKRKLELKKFFEDAVPFLQTTLKEHNINAEIKTRIKHYFSIYKKALRYQNRDGKTDISYQNINDIAGMRVIVESVEQCYLAEDIIKNVWTEQVAEREDYIKTPKPSGYKSIHNVYSVGPKMNLEIQIRTRQMHEENEFGNASHFFYKIGNKFKENILDNPNWLKEINYWESQTRLLENYEIKHFRDFVYAFTPKGDIIELPRGANIIDFAYYIHTRVGNNCTGGVVNGNIVKIDYEIKDGDRVEIMNTKHPKKPSPDWIKVAKTKKAISMIRKSLYS
jgi:GTP diphosphokinase / guanosine-3',5'-bis(diphosphate) 3'-diphosphatase